MTRGTGLHARYVVHGPELRARGGGGAEPEAVMRRPPRYFMAGDPRNACRPLSKMPSRITCGVEIPNTPNVDRPVAHDAIGQHERATTGSDSAPPAKPCTKGWSIATSDYGRLAEQGLRLDVVCTERQPHPPKGRSLLQVLHRSLSYPKACISVYKPPCAAPVTAPFTDPLLSFVALLTPILVNG